MSLFFQDVIAFYDTIPENLRIPSYYVYGGASYEVQLDLKGEVQGVLRLEEESKRKGKGKKLVPRRMRLPSFPRTSGVASRPSPFADQARFYLWEPEALRKKGKKAPAGPQWRDRVIEMLQEFERKLPDTPEIGALLKFVTNPTERKKVPLEIELQTGKKELPAQKQVLVFRVNGRLLHEIPEVSAAWGLYLEQGYREEGLFKRGTCAILGHEAEIPSQHKPPIGADFTAKLISVSSSMFRRRGQDGAEGCGFSREAVNRYIGATQFLLDREDNRLFIAGGVYLAFVFNPNADEKTFHQLQRATGFKDVTRGDPGDVFSEQDETSEAARNTLQAMTGSVGKIASGRLPMEDSLFCLAVLTREQGRGRVEMYFRNDFSVVQERVLRFCEAQSLHLSYGMRKRFLSIQDLAEALESKYVPPPVKPEEKKLREDRLNPLKRIFLESAYLEKNISRATAMQALRLLVTEEHLWLKEQQGYADGNRGKRKYWGSCKRARLAILKMYLTQTTGEDMRATLDPDNTNPGYLLGRYFATLEAAERSAQSGNKGLLPYLRDALNSPNRTFPKLRIACEDKHLGKLKAKRKKRPAWLFRGRIEEITKLMGHNSSPFPAALTPEDKMYFFLGRTLQEEEMRRISKLSYLGDDTVEGGGALWKARSSGKITVSEFKRKRALLNARLEEEEKKALQRHYLTTPEEDLEEDDLGEDSSEEAAA